jgi:hypothetical protein
MRPSVTIFLPPTSSSQTASDDKNKDEVAGRVFLFLKERAKIERRRKGLISQVSSGRTSPGSIE